MRILMAVGKTTVNENLLTTFVSGFRHENGQVLVLHILEPVEPVAAPEMAQDYAPELEDEKQPACTLVERIAAELNRIGFTVRTEVVIGDITQTILDTAAAWPADLIVVGSRGQKGIREFLLGSIADSVARRAGCSVAIVRPPFSS